MSVQIREKSYFGEKSRVPSYRLLPYTKKLQLGTRKVHLLRNILLNSLLTKKPDKPVLFSELKALVNLEKFRDIVFTYRRKQ